MSIPDTIHLAVKKTDVLEHSGNAKAVRWSFDPGDLDALRKVIYTPLRRIDRESFQRPVLSSYLEIQAGGEKPMSRSDGVAVYPTEVLIKKFATPPELAALLNEVGTNLLPLPENMAWGWKPRQDKFSQSFGVFKSGRRYISKPVEARTWLFDAWGTLRFDWITE